MSDGTPASASVLARPLRSWSCAAFIAAAPGALDADITASAFWPVASVIMAVVSGVTLAVPVACAIE
jgi:hypothetical protein